MTLWQFTFAILAGLLAVGFMFSGAIYHRPVQIILGLVIFLAVWGYTGPEGRDEPDDNDDFP